MTNDELRAAALDVLRRAGDILEEDATPMCVSAVQLAKAYLADHPDDGSEPVTDPWLLRYGFTRLRRIWPVPPIASGASATREVYVASRASLPARGKMWRAFRAAGMPINSSWIDEDGPNESSDIADLWDRIRSEVTRAERLVLYVEPEDFPLKGALVEVGMALGAQVPVIVVAHGVELEPRSFRPLGSWVKSPLVRFAETLGEAFEMPLAPKAPVPV